MAAPYRVDPTQQNFTISRALEVSVNPNQSGPPLRPDGLSVGIVTMHQDAPHAGEMHPDGDEILYVISGSVRVECDATPEAPMTLVAGQACVVPAGEWHRVRVLEPVTLLHITPGPGGEHRPLPDQARQ